MKRYIIFFAICSCLLSCEIESAQKPTRERYTPGAYMLEITEGRVVFPLAMMETAFNIETYENATPEEKVEMTYIFNSLLKQGNNYKMTNFYSFYMIPDDNSIHAPGASWNFSAYNSGGCPSEFTLVCAEEDRWEMTAKYDNGQITYNIMRLPQDESIFNWEVTFAGSLTSAQGRLVDFFSVEPITRKVSADEWNCTTVMTGTLKLVVYENEDSNTPKESFTYSFNGQEEKNTYYQL